MNTIKGQNVTAVFKREFGSFSGDWWYLLPHQQPNYHVKLCTDMVRQFVDMGSARKFEVTLSTTKPPRSDYYHTLCWDRAYQSWRPQGVTGYAPSFLSGVNNFISHRFYKRSPVYITVYTTT